MFESTRHRLLVAAPNLGDPNFERTVVLMLEHNAAGALGLVLNRRSDTAVADLLPSLGGVIAEPQYLFVGGPVGVGGLLALGREQWGRVSGAGTPIVDRLLVLDPGEVIRGELDGVETVRLYTGYSGWDAGQLDGELLSGGWIVADADTTDLLTDDPDSLWRRVLSRQEGAVSRLAAFPDDLEMN